MHMTAGRVAQLRLTHVYVLLCVPCCCSPLELGLVGADVLLVQVTVQTGLDRTGGTVCQCAQCQLLQSAEGSPAQLAAAVLTAAECGRG